MSDPSKKPFSNEEAERAIQEALESVERIERERKKVEGDLDDELDPEKVEVLPPSDAPPSGDPSGAGAGEDEGEELHLEEEAPAEEKKPKKADPMLEAMIKAKNEAVAALEQTQKEAKSLHERLLRVSADFDNYKKRQARERAESVRFANESLLKELMPVLDNLDRAIAAIKDTAEAEGGAAKTLLEGVEMVHRQFLETLGRFGVEPFSALGQPFDPARHEAVAQREDTSVPNQTVIEEYQKGYMLHDRLVRPAMVVVSSGGPKEEAKAAPDGAGAECGAFERESGDAAEDGESAGEGE